MAFLGNLDQQGTSDGKDFFCSYCLEKKILTHDVMENRRMNVKMSGLMFDNCLRESALHLIFLCSLRCLCMEQDLKSIWVPVHCTEHIGKRNMDSFT